MPDFNDFLERELMEQKAEKPETKTVELYPWQRVISTFHDRDGFSPREAVNYVGIPSVATQCDLTATALTMLVEAYVKAHGAEPTTLLYASVDHAIAERLRHHRTPYGEPWSPPQSLVFWVSVPTMHEGVFAVVGEDGIAMSIGA